MTGTGHGALDCRKQTIISKYNQHPIHVESKSLSIVIIFPEYWMRSVVAGQVLTSSRRTAEVGQPALPKRTYACHPCSFPIRAKCQQSKHGEIHRPGINRFGDGERSSKSSREEGGLFRTYSANLESVALEFRYSALPHIIGLVAKRWTKINLHKILSSSQNSIPRVSHGTCTHSRKHLSWYIFGYESNDGAIRRQWQAHCLRCWYDIPVYPFPFPYEDELLAGVRDWFSTPCSEQSRP